MQKNAKKYYKCFEISVMLQKGSILSCIVICYKICVLFTILKSNTQYETICRHLWQRWLCISYSGIYKIFSWRSSRVKVQNYFCYVLRNIDGTMKYNLERKGVMCPVPVSTAVTFAVYQFLVRQKAHKNILHCDKYSNNRGQLS